jgi:hypothetical protein
MLAAWYSRSFLSEAEDTGVAMNASQQSALKQIQRVITAILPHDRQMNSEKKLRSEHARVKPAA